MRQVPPVAVPHPDRRRQILQAGDNSGKPVGLVGIVRGTQLEHHLLLGAELESLQVTTTVEIPDVQCVAILASQEHLRDHAVLHHLRCAPLAGDHRVVTEVPPEVVRQVLRPTILLPGPFDLECFRVEDEDAAGAVAVGVAQRVDVDAIGPAVRGVRAAVAGLAKDFLGFDHLDQARLPRVRRGIEDVDSRRSHARHHEIAPLHVRVRRVRAQARAARVPPEVVQLVAGAGHVDARDLCAVAGRCGIDIQHGKGVAGGRVGIEQRHVGMCFHWRLHGHRRRRVEALVGKQFRHRRALLAVSVRVPETRIKRTPESFEKAGVFLKLS